MVTRALLRMVININDSKLWRLMFNIFKKHVQVSSQEGSFPLQQAKSGINHLITGFTADKGMLQKLLELGLPTGSNIRVLQHQAGGGVVVAKDNMRIALGPAVTAQIQVSLL